MATKYQVLWESMRNGLTGVSNNNHKAFCKLCRQEFSVKQNGEEKVKQHEKSAKHLKAVNELKMQATLGCGQTGSTITVSKLIAKAEVIQALHVRAANNFSKPFRHNVQKT